MEKERSKKGEEREEGNKNGVGIGIGIGAGNGNGNGNGEEIQRITVSRDAQGALGNIVDRVNDGFTGGKVNRTQMANWILLRFNSELNEAHIKEIRAEHFDEVAMLESILRQAKETGNMPSDFKALLQKQLGTEDNGRKKRSGT